ncbi:MAG: hypothetical protein WC624_04470 [Candidatus Margulisiibacteriota bacterium]
MKKWIVGSLIVWIFAVPAIADLTPWADIWLNSAYHSTNGERNTFNSFLTRSEGRFGVRLADAIPGFAIDPYVAYYLVNSQDQNYWNNNLAVGPGVRILPFLGYQSTSWANEWLPDIKIFSEALTLTTLNDQATADRDKVKLTDSRFGIDLWHEWNLKDIDYKVPWAEIWGNASYRQTNFFAEANNFPGNQFRTYLVYLQTKFGVHMTGGIRPYLATYLTTCGASKSWLNNLYYGVGLRMEPFREQKDSPEIMKKFKMFIEVLGVAWLKENEGRPSNDIRFGVDLTFGR